MDELQQKILIAMRDPNLSDDGISVNMEKVAQKLGTDISDSQFQKATEELEHNGYIKYIDSINAKLTD